MTFKTNVAGQARGLWFAQNGQDVWDGKSIETPKKTIQAAVDAANALSPPPAPANSGQVIAAQGGVFAESFVLEDSILFSGTDVSLTSNAPVSIELASFLSCNLTTATNIQAGATVFNIDGKQSVGIRASFCGAFGASSIGVNIEGACDNLFITLSQVEMRGDGATAVKFTGESPSPIDMNFNTITMLADNTTFIEWDPINATDTGTINVSSITDGLTGTTAFLVKNGTLRAFSNEINTETAIDVRAGAELDLAASNVVGDIIVASGAILCAVIQNYTGTITNNGTINGVINGVHYGNWFGGSYQYDSDETESTTTSMTFVNKLTLTTPANFPAGDYRVSGHGEMTNNTNNKSVVIRGVLDGGITNEFTYVPKLGDEYFPFTSFVSLPLTAGVHTIDLDFKAGANGGTAKVRRARIDLFRVNL